MLAGYIPLHIKKALLRTLSMLVFKIPENLQYEMAFINAISTNHVEIDFIVWGDVVLIGTHLRIDHPCINKRVQSHS